MSHFSRTCTIALFAICSLLSSGRLTAQVPSISAEQQALINQLPPTQRRQALDAIRRMQVQASGQMGLEPTTLREDLTEVAPGGLMTDAEDTDEEPVAETGSTLVIHFEPIEELHEQVEADSALSRISGAGVYSVEDSGVIALPGLVEVPVLGLSEEEVEIRLGAEPTLRPFAITVDILAASPIGVEALEPFGYDIFAASGDGGGFDPVVAGPVPPDYVLGPGDSVRVQLYGNVNEIYEIEVSRDAVLNLPQIGPITVAGLTFAEFRSDVGQRVADV